MGVRLVAWMAGPLVAIWANAAPAVPVGSDSMIDWDLNAAPALGDARRARAATPARPLAPHVPVLDDAQPDPIAAPPIRGMDLDLFNPTVPGFDRAQPSQP